MVTWFDEDDDDWAPKGRSDSEQTSLFQAYLIGLEERLNLIDDPKQETILLDFAPSFAQLLKYAADSWEKDHFSLMTATRTDGKAIRRSLGQAGRMITLPSADDVLVYGDAIIEILQKEQDKLAHNLDKYLPEDKLADIMITGKTLAWAISESVEAVIAGFNVLEPYRGDSIRRSGGQDRRQLKVGSALNMKVSI